MQDYLRCTYDGLIAWVCRAEETDRAWCNYLPCLCPCALLGFAPHLPLPTEMLPVHHARRWGLPTLAISFVFLSPFFLKSLLLDAQKRKLLTLLFGFKHSQ